MLTHGSPPRSVKIRSGGKDLRNSGKYPRDFGRQVATFHLDWMETLKHLVFLTKALFMLTLRSMKACGTYIKNNKCTCTLHFIGLLLPPTAVDTFNNIYIL